MKIMISLAHCLPRIYSHGSSLIWVNEVRWKGVLVGSGNDRCLVEFEWLFVCAVEVPSLSWLPLFIFYMRVSKALNVVAAPSAQLKRIPSSLVTCTSSLSWPHSERHDRPVFVHQGQGGFGLTNVNFMSLSPLHQGQGGLMGWLMWMSWV
jgi:hypothetical protein